MRLNWKQMLLGVVMASFGSAAYGYVDCRDRGDRIVLHFDDEEFRTRGEYEPILIRRTLRQACGQEFRTPIEKVRLVAKSRFGRASAYLEAGRAERGRAYQSRTERIAGSPDSFYDTERYTFDRINFSVPARFESKGLRIFLRGNVIVRKLVLIKGYGDGGGVVHPGRQIRCESDNYRYAECATGSRNLRRSDVRIYRQLSGTPCRFDESWGINPRRGSIWVSEGCRAIFEVDSRGRGGRDRDRGRVIGGSGRIVDL